MEQPNIPGLPALPTRECGGCRTVRLESDFRNTPYCRFCSRFANALRLGVPYDRLLVEQGNACAICGVDAREVGRALAIDHVHVPPEERDGYAYVRGLLCRRCNQLLGSAADDPALLMKAAAYLGREPQRFYLPVVTAKRRHRDHRKTV